MRGPRTRWCMEEMSRRGEGGRARWWRGGGQCWGRGGGGGAGRERERERIRQAQGRGFRSGQESAGLRGRRWRRGRRRGGDSCQAAGRNTCITNSSQTPGEERSGAGKDRDGGGAGQGTLG